MNYRDDDDAPEHARRRARKIRLFDKEYRLPESRLVRIAIGVLLVVFGVLGFLPVLGFWMIPLGLLVLSADIAAIRRLRRKLTVYFASRRKS